MSNKTDLSDPNFQALFEAAPGAYLILSPELIIVAVNENYLSVTMTQRESILGKYLFDAFPDNPNEVGATGTSNLRASLNRVLKQKKTDSMAIQKYDIKRPDGRFEVRYWSAVNSPVLNHMEEISYIIHSIEDVTDFVRLKQERINQSKVTQELRDRIDQTEKIKQAQRMEAMGQLAGGIAHDFNNMLAVIIMNCEVMLNQKTLEQQSSKSFNQIKKTAEKAAKLTHQLLAFSSKQVFKPKVVNMNTIIKDLDAILKRLINETIEISFNLDPYLGNIIADSTQIEQILINLIVNARDALASGGKIFVETKNATLDQISSKGNPVVEPGDYVELSVTDTGIGMDAITQARIFEPFFTTKCQGKGTGLGLSTIYGIVSQNKGTIWVTSELHRGSAFKIYLPIVKEEVAHPTQENQNTFINKSARVLVVDDEADLKSLIKDILVMQGFEVITASNGKEGLSTIEKETKPFDLIISDVMMPTMSGPELKEELEIRGIQTPFLFLSGYSEDTLFNKLTTMNQPEFLEKPFNSAALIEKIHTLLLRQSSGLDSNESL